MVCALRAHYIVPLQLNCDVRHPSVLAAYDAAAATPPRPFTRMPPLRKRRLSPSEAVVKLPGTLSGVAGEYFVAAELSRRGYIATLTLRNAQGIDIIAANPRSTRSVGIQVKTSQSAVPAWLASKKVEDSKLARNLFFVFVSLNGLDQPSFHIVPRSVVANYLRTNHRAWLNGTKRDGGARKDTAMRIFRDLSGEYRDRWDLLGLGAPSDV